MADDATGTRATEVPDQGSLDNHKSDESAPSEGGVTWQSLIPERLREFWSGSVSGQYLKECSRMLWRNVWTLMSLTALNSAARFVLVWTLYKTVCAMAVRFFGIPADSIPHEMIPSSGSSGDPNVYQQLADITFLIFKPFDFVLKGIFIAAGLLVCWGSINDPQSNSDDSKRFRLIRRMWSGFILSLTSAWTSLLLSPRYMLVYIVTGALTALYQGMCLLIIPFLYAIRRLMNIQLGLSITLLQKAKVEEALSKSESLIKPVRQHLYLPYFILLLTPKVLGVTREFVVKAFPDRLFVDVPEITWGLIATTTVMAFLIDRMAEIFPIVIYSATKAKESHN